MTSFTFLKEMSCCGCASDCGFCVWGEGRGGRGLSFRMALCVGCFGGTVLYVFIYIYNLIFSA